MCLAVCPLLLQALSSSSSSTGSVTTKDNQNLDVSHVFPRPATSPAQARVGKHKRSSSDGQVRGHFWLVMVSSFLFDL